MTVTEAERQVKRTADRVERARNRATDTATRPLNTPALDSATAKALGFTVKLLKSLPASQSDHAMRRAVGREVVVTDKTTSCGDFVRVRYGKTEMWAHVDALKDLPTP